LVGELAQLLSGTFGIASPQGFASGAGCLRLAEGIAQFLEGFAPLSGGCRLRCRVRCATACLRLLLPTARLALIVPLSKQA
jgi:hypothetical protein